VPAARHRILFCNSRPRGGRTRRASPGWARRGESGQYAARAARSIAPGLILALALGLGGCLPPTPGGFDSPDPTSRLAAISDAGATGDRSAIPQLVEQLESSDAGARLLAIRALEKITGQTLGYHHADPWWERSAAVRRWRRWAEENTGLPGADLSGPDAG
jgi:hypothetical protein